MAHSVGILMIGSLCWDNSDRQSWRESRLAPGGSCLASAPIRYGRYSKGGKRKNTFTMIFSPSAGAGKARLARCKQDAASPADLILEAEELWKAEDEKARSRGGIWWNWGCVALLIRPESNVPPEIIEGWSRQFVGGATPPQIAELGTGDLIVNRQGMLTIPWPRSLVTGKPVELDLILATANQPTNPFGTNRYPTPAEIAKAWLSKPGSREYFDYNHRDQICTFEDEEILRELGN